MMPNDRLLSRLQSGFYQQAAITTSVQEISGNGFVCCPVGLINGYNADQLAELKRIYARAYELAREAVTRRHPVYRVFVPGLN